MIDLENFLIIEKVGAGSYSTVYKAQTKVYLISILMLNFKLYN